ncbi:hypothetical protein AL523_07525 [Enterococcus gallinarum]|nr:hypothetical protein AL523_07525 [Enterococcus gallinarum]
MKWGLGMLIPCLFLFFSCGKEGREVNYLVDEIPPERIVGKIVGKNTAQLFLDVEITDINLVLLDSLDISVGDNIHIYFDEMVSFDFVVENLNPKELDFKRRAVFSNYQMDQKILYYFRDNIPKKNELILKNDNDLRLID